MDQIKIGRFISEMRKEQGITQKQLAERLEISDKTVSKWECGNGLPEISLMVPLCNALQINVNELLFGERLSEDAYSGKAEVLFLGVSGQWGNFIRGFSILRGNCPLQREALSASLR